MKMTAVGIPWYRRENYERLLGLFDDGEQLHDTFNQWLAEAELGRERLEREGRRVIRVNIDPDEFSAWCASRRRKLDAKARSEYASSRATR